MSRINLIVHSCLLAATVALGDAMAGLHDLDGAIAEIQEALALDPDRPSGSYTNLGVLQNMRGKPVDAEAAFKRAIVIDPKSVNAYLALANFYWSGNRLQ